MNCFSAPCLGSAEVMHAGTAAIEIKSGYGLTVRDEVKMLRVARRMGRETPLTVRTTFRVRMRCRETRLKEVYPNHLARDDSGCCR